MLTEFVRNLYRPFVRVVRSQMSQIGFLYSASVWGPFFFVICVFDCDWLWFPHQWMFVVADWVSRSLGREYFRVFSAVDVYGDV